jgi:hypothetical protein
MRRTKRTMVLDSVLPRQITDTESGLTATISGRMSVGRSLKYRVLVVHFEDIDTVIGIPMALAEQLIEEMKQQIEDIRKRTH